MPVPEVASLVARFLKANHYYKTFEAFIEEAGLSEDAGSSEPGEPTIEQILQEKQQFDTSLAYQKHGSDTTKGWTEKSPVSAHEPDASIGANVLCVHGDAATNRIFATTADRKWRSISGQQPYLDDNRTSSVHDSPVLSIVSAGNLVFSTDMSGRLSIYDRRSRTLIDTCRHHTKYAVQVAAIVDDDTYIVATAGWDQKIHFYAANPGVLETMSDSSSPGLVDEPIHSQPLPTNPESILFVRHPDSHTLYLIASRRDSTHLYYFKVERMGAALTVTEAGRQNLAPHSNAWVAFTPCSLSPCPGDPTLVAVATSHLPYMKLIIIRLLFPDFSDRATESTQLTQAVMARQELARQDREDAAIKIHVSTMAPQTPYSTPQVVWRPDASGLYVNGDDGVVRGIEASTGKVVQLLKGHEAGSKVRTLWAGIMTRSDDEVGHEVLISGGFDKKLLIWTS